MISLRALILSAASCLAFSLSASAALNPGPNDVYVRVVDNGPGLCTITKIPGPHFMIYDAGHWTQGHACVNAAEEIIGSNAIDLLVLSHSDGDHIADGDDILKAFRVKQVIRTGFRREDTSGWPKLNNAIGDEAKLDATVINLQTTTLVPGTELALGNATATLIAGWGEWTASPVSSLGERRNAISIVVRLDYAGSSVLFGGDTVGRRLGDDDTACKDAEKIMVDRHNAGEVSLQADVIIAPHHGANNASSRCFIDAVAPSFVVFSAGHDNQHPTAGAAGRYLAHGVPLPTSFAPI